MCTLRNFPHLIDHCIEWSRAKFSDLFVTPAQQLQLFLDDPFDFLEKLRAETVDKVRNQFHQMTGAIDNTHTGERQLTDQVVDDTQSGGARDVCLEPFFLPRYIRAKAKGNNGAYLKPFFPCPG